MKLLIASHASVLAVNRKIFASLAKVTGWEITLLVPQFWRGDLIADLHFQPCDDDLPLTIIDLPVVLPGKGSFFYYKSLPKSPSKPDLVLIDEEPWSINAFQLYREYKGVRKIFYTKQNIKKRLPPPFAQIQNYVFRNSTGAFAVTEEVSQVLRQKNYFGPIEILPHSYDPELFHLPVIPTASKRIRIGYVGRLDEEKGLRVLFAAIRVLYAKQSFLESTVDFLIVGNGELEAWVRAELETLPLDRVEYSAALPHDRVGELLRTLDLLVLPSQTTARWKEQFGRIIIEAWASGAAVIGSDSGEIPNLIRRSGAGLIFHERSSAELAEKIETYAASPDLLKQHKTLGREYVTRTLTHDQLAQDLAAKLKTFFNSAT